MVRTYFLGMDSVLHRFSRVPKGGHSRHNLRCLRASRPSRGASLILDDNSREVTQIPSTSTAALGSWSLCLCWRCLTMLLSFLSRRGGRPVLATRVLRARKPRKWGARQRSNNVWTYDTTVIAPISHVHPRLFPGWTFYPVFLPRAVSRCSNFHSA